MANETNITGEEYEPQTYKTDSDDWKDRYNAFILLGMISVQANFNGVLSEMEAANDAITIAGIEGISEISITFSREQTAAIEDKRSNLCFFTNLVYHDAVKQIDDPFYDVIYPTACNTKEHKSLLITYAGTVIDLPYEYCSPQNIFLIMTSALDSSSYDDFLKTDDEETNALMALKKPLRTGIPLLKNRGQR